MGRALHYVDVAAIVQVAMDRFQRALDACMPKQLRSVQPVALVGPKPSGARFQPRLFFPGWLASTPSETAICNSYQISTRSYVIPAVCELPPGRGVAAEKTARLAVHGSRTAACEQQSCWRYAMAAARYRRI